MFYTPDIATTQTLSEIESRHAIKVLRLKEGDTLTLLDGKGSIYKARITHAHAKQCAFDILSHTTYPRHSYHLHIAIAPTKNIDRMEWFVEKCTEIGIDAITPIFCQFSERKRINEERLAKIIIAASKQSKRPHFPLLHPSTSFATFVQQKTTDQRYIAHCYDMPKSSLFETATTNQPIRILIGPEGDFSTEEVATATAEGYTPISLGENRLRTETAGVIACHTIVLKNQENFE